MQHLVSGAVAFVRPEITGREALQLILRWFHFIAGIMWVGLLYFFNVINVPFMKQVDAAAKPKIFENLTLPALNWFRWSSLATVFIGLWYWGDFIVGEDSRMQGGGGGKTMGLFFLLWIGTWAILFLLIKKVTPNGYVLGAITAILVYAAGWLFVNYTPVGGDDNHVLCIGVGGGMGILMLFNVWGVIWPNNKKIIRATLAGTCAEAGPAGVPGVAHQLLSFGSAAVLHGRRIALLEHGHLRQIRIALCNMKRRGESRALFITKAIDVSRECRRARSSGRHCPASRSCRPNSKYRFQATSHASLEHPWLAGFLLVRSLPCLSQTWSPSRCPQ